jgi:hypothetical protein
MTTEFVLRNLLRRLVCKRKVWQEMEKHCEILNGLGS